MPVPSFFPVQRLLFTKAANGRSVSVSGPSDFSGAREKPQKVLVSTIGPRRISLCGATFFARGGKEGKTPLEPLRFKSPARRECGEKSLC